MTSYAAFGGVSVPGTGRAGWFYGTDRWPEGEYFRYQITSLQLIGEERTDDWPRVRRHKPASSQRSPAVGYRALGVVSRW